MVNLVITGNTTASLTPATSMTIGDTEAKTATTPRTRFKGEISFLYTERVLYKIDKLPELFCLQEAI